LFPLIQQENIMKVTILAAALAAAALASPAAAQEVIYNPGYCAQFYPNANCQNKGPGNPYTGNSWRSGWQRGYAWAGPRPWRHRHYRHYRRY
jgi:opacity protein-like surface antigen